MNGEINFEFMSLALALAKKGQGKARPNPCVGAIVVKNKKIVGRGFHEKYGSEHAEVIALKQAGKLSIGADLYITLEPCNHQGKTPPCTSTIISSGISNVFIAMEDPNPLVNGSGIAHLELNGIKVITGIMEDEAKNLNLGFINRMIKSRPYVRSKIAISLDGKTSLSNGESKWITSEESRADVQKWRLKSCAILTGKGTINFDNPTLSVRGISSKQQPLRIILDSHLEIKPDSKILKESNIIVIYGEDKDLNIKKLKKNKVTFIKLPLLNNRINLRDLMAYLNELNINELLVESGPELNGQLLSFGFLDELITYTAPYIMGGNANSMFNTPILNNMNNKIKFSVLDIRSFGEDIRIQAKPIKKDVD